MAGTWCLGIEIGGTKLQLGIGQGRGEILALKRLQVDPSRQAAGIRRQISGAFPDLVAEAGIDRTAIVAAGVGFGGPVDADRGRIERSYQIDGWEDFPLADWIRDNLGVPAVVVQNDADTAGLAESRFGAGKGMSPLLYMTVGSGIGGALIIEDRIYRGFGKGAGEIGHLLVPVEDAGSDRRGVGMMELEQVASGWAIGRAGQELLESGGFAGFDLNELGILETSDGRGPGRVTGWVVAQAARRGVPGAVSILVRARAAIGFALAQAIALMAPRRIVIGGGVSLNGADWFDGVRQSVETLVFPPFRDGFDIVPAALGEEVVVHGALALARDVATHASLQ
jgi:glucokinase